MKILISSVGSLVGQNILEVLKYSRENLTIIGTNSIPDAALYDCDRIYLSPESELPPSEYAKSLSEIIRKESPDLIIPGRDIDVVILSLLKDDFPDIKHKFLVGSPEIAKLMENKLQSFHFSKQEKIPFAETILFDRENAAQDIDKFVEKFGFPLIVKPVKGFASRGVSIVLNKEQLFGLQSDAPVILQEYLGNADKVKDFKRKIREEGFPLFYSFEEVKYSIQLYIGRNGELKGHLVSLHKMVKGVSDSVEIIENPVLQDLAERYYHAFRKSGWYGPVNIQLQKSKKSGDFKGYEFNGRFTGATAARYFLGHDELGLAFEDAGFEAIKKDRRYGSQKIASKQPFISEMPVDCIKVLQESRQWENKV